MSNAQQPQSKQQIQQHIDNGKRFQSDLIHIKAYLSNQSQTVPPSITLMEDNIQRYLNWAETNQNTLGFALSGQDQTAAGSGQ